MPVKPTCFSRWCAPMILASLLACSLTATAQCGATIWTSVDGRSIRAQLYGLHQDQAIFCMRGKTYQVPLSRLTPQCREKVARMLDLPSAKAKASAITPTAPVPVTAEPRNSVEPTPRENLATSAPGGLGQEIELPAFDDTADPDGSVLPARGSILPDASREVADSGSRLGFEGTHLFAPSGLPSTIIRAIEAGNRLQTKSYKSGGGRARLEDSGYDCSGSVSYVLIKAGLLRSPLNSGGFTRYGAPGKGRWITIHARNGHVFMTICGLRLDTGGSGGRGESGPRWRTHMRGTCGFVMRHPPGF